MDFFLIFLLLWSFQALNSDFFVTDLVEGKGQTTALCFIFMLFLSFKDKIFENWAVNATENNMTARLLSKNNSNTKSGSTNTTVLHFILKTINVQ